MEEWRDVKGYEGLYLVSSLGNIKNVKFNRLLKGGVGSGGYHNVTLHNKTGQKTKDLHIVVAEAFLNHKPNGRKIVVDHIDNDRSNNSVENLQVITFRENTSKDRIGSSKYTGVYWRNDISKWRSVIQINGKKVNLGHYDCEVKASKAYQKRLEELK